MVARKKKLKIKTRKIRGGRVWTNGLPFGVARAGMLLWVIIVCGTSDKCAVCTCGRFLSEDGVHVGQLRNACGFAHTYVHVCLSTSAGIK